MQKGQLAVEGMKHAGFTFTHSLQSFVTDSSAAATALATGYLALNGQVGMTVDGTPVKTVLEYAEAEGKWTGLVATSRITHATPASMVSHVKSRGSEDEIAAQITKSNVEVIFGGGWDKFLPRRKSRVGLPPSPGKEVLASVAPAALSSALNAGAGMSLAAAPAEPLLLGLDGKPYGTRSDGRDLMAEMLKQGYRLIRTPAELSMVSAGPPTKVLGLFHSGPMPKASEGRSPGLPAMTLSALRILSQSPKGFFLMVEGSQIDWGGHANDFAYTVAETADFDTAVGTVLDFLEDTGIAGETLVVVTADHETGGLSLTPNSALPMGVEPKWSTKGHTGCPVPIFSAGPGADLFSGIQTHEEIGRNLVESVSSKDVRFAYPPDKSLPIAPAAPAAR
jgi:alkaline phosphatase